MRIILRPFYALWLFIVFIWDLIASSVQVAVAVIAPGDRTKPRLVTVPLEATTPVQITLVANFISLTPGTLSVDVSRDEDTLLVHDLVAGDSSEGTREAVRPGIEARVLRATQ